MARRRGRAATETRIVRRGPSAAEKKLEALRESSRRARERARRTRDERQEMATGIVTAAALGWAEQSGWLARVPTLGGLPRLVTVAGVGLAGGMYVSGTAGDLMRGVGTSAAMVAAYQLASRGTISGEGGQGGLEQAVRRLAARVRDDEGVSGDYGFDDDPSVAGYMVDDD